MSNLKNIDKFIAKTIVAEFKELGKKCFLKECKENILVYDDGREETLEIKRGPANPMAFYTFKESTLRSVSDPTKKMILYFSDHYVILGADACAFLLNNFVKKIYSKFCDSELAVRVYSKNYGKTKDISEEDLGPVFWEELMTIKLAHKKTWSKKAQSLINQAFKQIV